jgi:hypothetical protein
MGGRSRTTPLRRALLRGSSIFVSPFCRRRLVRRVSGRFAPQVPSTGYDTTSILKLIETRWGLQPLGTRDAGANGLEGVFQ